ncbi:MAG: NAD(P)-dependent oxidoreductase [Flavobacterium sp.]
MKSVAIVGATGSTGKEVVRLALSANYRVVIVARNPAKILPEKNVSIAKGDVTDYDSLELAFRNVDFVISCFGPANNRKIDKLLSIGAGNIVKACEKNQVQRFIFMSGFVQAPYSELSFATKMLMPIFRLIYKESYNDKVIAEATIQKSNLVWTIVRASGLNKSVPTRIYKAGINSKIYFVMLPYSDCALCLLDAIDEKEWFRKIINVGKL